MQDFQSIATWKKAHGLTLRVFEETKTLPRDETFGITMLLRRSATAIASQIAEGCGGAANGEASADLRKAASHCVELEYLVLLTKDLALWPPSLCDELMASAVEIRSMVQGALH